MIMQLKTNCDSRCMAVPYKKNFLTYDDIFEVRHTLKQQAAFFEYLEQFSSKMKKNMYIKENTFKWFYQRYSVRDHLY